MAVEPGKKVRVVRYGDPDGVSIDSNPTIVGEVGIVLGPGQMARFFTRVDFPHLLDHRRGEWLFLDDEIEAVE